MPTLTWITEKELEREIKKATTTTTTKKRPISLEEKLESFEAAVRKRRNANKVEVSGSERKETEREHIVLLFF